MRQEAVRAPGVGLPGIRQIRWGLLRGSYSGISVRPVQGWLDTAELKCRFSEQCAPPPFIGAYGAVNSPIQAIREGRENRVKISNLLKEI